MKNFDTERDKRLEGDRSFQLAGETFTHRPAVAPEAIREWSAMVGGEYVMRDENDKPIQGPPEAARDADGNLIVRGGQLVKPEDGEEGDLVLHGGQIQMVPGQPISTLTEQQALDIYERTVKAFLEPGQEDKWARVRDPNLTNPVTVRDLSALITWLFTETSGRPTGQSSGSTPSGQGGQNGAPAIGSTVALPSPAVAPSA